MTEQILRSSFSDLGKVALPEWQGRSLRMHTIDPTAPVMQEGFEDYMKPVVALCEAANIQAAEVYMTVDEKLVTAGRSQRRPGAHVEGAWVPATRNWCGQGACPAGWKQYAHRMATVVASSAPGCIVYEGEFRGSPKDGGDLEHIRDQFGEGVVLPAFRGFLMSPDCVHESMILPEQTKRSFLRIVFH